MELIALTDLGMREQHGLVEDCPLHRLVAGRGGQRAVVVEVEFQVGRQQTCNVESGHQDFLAWEKKHHGSETGATSWRTTGRTSMEIMGSLALRVPGSPLLLVVHCKKSSGFALEAGESTCKQRAPWKAVSVQAVQCSPSHMYTANACCSLSLPCSGFLCWAAAPETSTRWDRALPSLWILYRCSSIS